MDLLNINHSNGFVINQADVRWLQDAIRNAIINSSIIAGVDTYILSGMARTLTDSDANTIVDTLEVTDGWMVIDGEPYEVEGLAPTNPLPTHVWVRILEAAEDLDSPTDTLGNPIAIHKSRKAVVEAGSSLPSSVHELTWTYGTAYSSTSWDTLSLAELIAEKAGAVRKVIKSNLIGVSPAPSFQNACANTAGADANSVRYFKTIDGLVVIQGNVTIGGSGGGATVIFTLPSGFRPDQQRTVGVLLTSTGVERLYINTSGELIGPAGAVGDIVMPAFQTF